MTESWKNRHCEHKQETGLTWEEYHEQYFYHEDEIDDLRETVDHLDKHVRAVRNSYDDLREELATVRMLAESER